MLLCWLFAQHGGSASLWEIAELLLRPLASAGLSRTGTFCTCLTLCSSDAHKPPSYCTVSLSPSNSHSSGLSSQLFLRAWNTSKKRMMCPAAKQKCLRAPDPHLSARSSQVALIHAEVLAGVFNNSPKCIICLCQSGLQSRFPQVHVVAH